MKLTVNDREVDVKHATNLEELVRELGVPPTGLAAEVAGEVVGSHRFHEIPVVEGQQVVLVRLVGGG